MKTYHIWNDSIPCFMGNYEAANEEDALQAFLADQPGHEEARLVVIPHNDMVAAIEEAQ